MSATSLPSLLHGLPIQQAPCNATTTPTSLPHLPPRGAAPTYQSGPYSRGQRLETVGGLPNSSLSALELLVHVDGQSDANSLTLPRSRPLELFTNFDSLNISESGTSSPRVNVVRTSGGTGIVYLPDDD